MILKVLQRIGELLLVMALITLWVLFCWHLLGATLACVIFAIQLCTFVLMAHAFRHAPLDDDYSNDNINTDYQDNN